MDYLQEDSVRAPMHEQNVDPECLWQVGVKKERPSNMAKRSRTRRKDRRSVPKGRVYIQSTFNNTIVTITDLEGGVICWGSSGTVGFKGSRKSTAFAAQRAAEDATRKGKEQGLREVDVLVSGSGAGREAAIRAMAGQGITVASIRDITPIPHNGCRPKKRRRV